jgi:hypothetical protein
MAILEAANESWSKARDRGLTMAGTCGLRPNAGCISVESVSALPLSA